jgi:diphthamide biosynthesis protein 7
MPEAAIASRLSLTLDLPPSCIQFCPEHPYYFVVGTYNLERDEPTDTQEDQDPGTKKSQSRNGSLLVYTISGDDL